jgi:multidrug transporter EmrE-like cation transporter
MTIFLLILAMVFNISAQYFLKQSVADLRFDNLNIGFFMKLVSNTYVWLGAVMYGASFVLYIMALSRGELSRISPVSQGLTTIGIVALSFFIFHEPLNALKIAGLLFIVIGSIIIFL